MGLFFCYSVFGRRPKFSRAVPDHGSQTGLSDVRKVNVESSVSAVKHIPLLNDMEEYNLENVTVKEVHESQKALPDLVPECDSFSKEQHSLESVDTTPKKHDVPECFLDVDKLASYQDSHHPPYYEHAKSSYDTHVSSCSQGTLQGEVSLSVGEGTLSSDDRRPVVPHEEVASMGGSLGPHEDAYSDYSFGGRSLHAQGFHDTDSAGRADISQELALGARYSDDGGGNCVGGSKFMAVAGGEYCLNSTPSPDPQVCDNDERNSRHASDPGYYAREVQKMSPGTCVEGSASPQADADDCMPLHFVVSVNAIDDQVDSTSQVHEVRQGVLPQKVYSSRVKEWVDSIQFSEVDFNNEGPDVCDGGNTFLDTTHPEPGEKLADMHIVYSGSANSVSLATAAVRSLHPSSTVAHLSGISLRELPALGVFNSLRMLNLSANFIAHVPVGLLPRTIHSLDLSRNRISQIEGFRELTRLRVLNLSYNRISRIGHGLANCTLIKELYLAGNKVGEVEGLHRLLKLAVLDLSFNKITTSKALGQLAANYGSLLALNLIGNPILTNFSEDQMRKLVTTLVPHVAYLNKQPIKAISVREAALDSVARAALGTSQRHSKSRDSKAGRKASGALSSTAKKKLPPHQHSRGSEKKVIPTASSGHYHPHSKVGGKAEGIFPTFSTGGHQRVASNSRKSAMSRSHSAGLLRE